MSETLTKYNIRFTYDDDTIRVSSDQALLSSRIEQYNTLHKANMLHLQIKNFLEFGQSEELTLPRHGIKRIAVTKVNSTFFSSDLNDNSPGNTFSLPSIDLQDILYNWVLHLQKYKTRQIEIIRGESIIDIISNGFINALVIDIAVAAHWPNCGGSVGEYYSVSLNDYDKQKELTANLNKVLISGSDSQVFEAIATFLNLFTNGNYNVALSEIDLNTSEIARDGVLICNDDAAEENKFTYWTYPSCDEMHLFTRSVNTIDQDRVAYYADLIANGERPKVVVYSNFNNLEDDETPHYIIDGHHKLLAYEQLRINIPCVYISKNISTELSRKNIAPQLLSVLKPVEMMHVLQEDDNIKDIETYMMPDITFYVDKILTEKKTIGSKIITVLYNAYHSKVEVQKNWAEERFVTLSKNENQGKGQTLYYKVQDPGQNCICYHQLFIENNGDFMVWKNVFLDDGKMPADVLARQQGIRQRYYPPYSPPRADYISIANYARPERVYPETNLPSWRSIILVIVILFKLIVLAKACS